MLHRSLDETNHEQGSDGLVSREGVRQRLPAKEPQRHRKLFRGENLLFWSVPSKTKLVHSPNDSHFEYHIILHIQALDIDGYLYCPASAAAGTDVVLCRHADHMKTDELQAHIKMIHGIDSVSGEKCVEKTKKRQRQTHGGKEAVLKRAKGNNSDDEKADTSKTREPLEAVSTNKRLTSATAQKIGWTTVELRKTRLRFVRNIPMKNSSTF